MQECVWKDVNLRIVAEAWESRNSAATQSRGPGPLHDGGSKKTRRP